jgi:hypothetical protein
MLNHKTILLIVTALLGFSGIQSALAQTDMFMEVPDIPGESDSKGYVGWFDVVNFHYHAEQEARATSGRGRSRSASVVDPVIVGKLGDAALG